MSTRTLPLLKWPGGKRWLASRVARIVQQHLQTGATYIEPFAGGAAVFFSLAPARAVLADVNAELMQTYEAVREDPYSILRALRRLPVTREAYYRIRSSEPRSSVARAARFLYLNRTAFAGMYRLNRAGQFNVPYGGGDRTPSLLWDAGILLTAARVLRSAKLRTSDFEAVMGNARCGDVIYCDPTYTVVHNNNGFVRYNEHNFSWTDQLRLARAASAASARGICVVVSNAQHRSIAALYPGWTRVLLRRPSTICPSPSARREIAEYLFVSPSKGE